MFKGGPLPRMTVALEVSLTRFSPGRNQLAIQVHEAV